MRIMANLSNFATSLSNVLNKFKIYLNFFVNMWKLSNAYTRHRIVSRSSYSFAYARAVNVSCY